MNEVDTQRLNNAYSRFDAGDYEKALEELRDLASTMNNPWDKAELLYHEAMFLLEMGKVSDARARVSEIHDALASLVESPCDGDEFDVQVSLPLMARHADLKVTAEEGKKLQALQHIEDLIARYPKQLSLPQFRTMSEEVKTLRGVLLVDLGRWEEAKFFLEDSTPPDVWRNYHCYHLGVCHYEVGNYHDSKKKLSEAISLGLRNSWEAKAHFILGLVEYRLSDMEAAKRQFELCAKSPELKYLDMAEVWRRLEETSRALGLQAGAENYRRMRTDLPQGSKPN